MTSPGRSARPARPETWVRSWNVRSADAEVRQAEADVRVDHAHQRDAREVVPLGDHLRAHEDLRLSRLESAQRLLQLAAPRRAVAIEAIHGRLRELSANRLDDLLGPVSALLQVLALARRAGSGRRRLVAAVVADRAAATLVQGQRNGAVRAVRLQAALAAEQADRVPAAVQEQQRLLLPVQADLDRVAQRGREDRDRRPPSAPAAGPRRRRAGAPAR